MSKGMIEEVIAASPNRRKFLKTLGVATAAVTALGVGATPAEAQTTTEQEVLNFALNLEYLESEFYTYGQYGYGIERLGIKVSGVATGMNNPNGGITTGGSKVTFSNSLVFSQAITEEIGVDERAHVTLLQSFLGDAAIARPNLDLGALGFGFGSENDFLTLSRIFEDIGVSAYGGAAHLLTTPLVIQTAARVLATEAEHVSTIRTQIARLNIPTSPLDGADLIPPPSGPQDQYLSVNPSNGLPAIRTVGQVLYLAYGNKAGVTQGGFFPIGVNGVLNMSTAPATAANLATQPAGFA